MIASSGLWKTSKTSAVELSLTFVKVAKFAIAKMTNSPIGVTTSDWTQGGGRSQIMAKIEGRPPPSLPASGAWHALTDFSSSEPVAGQRAATASIAR